MLSAQAGLAAAALTALQGLAGVALWAGRARVAGAMALACPLGVLAACLVRMNVPGSPPWQPLEWAYLLANGAAALLALLLLALAAGHSERPALVLANWALWAFNTASVLVLAALAFFFRLF